VITNSSNGKARVASVLLVEDSPAQALRFKSILEDNSYRVLVAENGLGGVEAAHQEQFDLILLDIELPDISGFEVCRRLKSDPAVADIPIIMLTTRDRAEDALTGLETGAIDYIPKDAFAEAVLLETLRQMAL
jgi:CheY-like chemotaxis protein